MDINPHFSMVMPRAGPAQVARRESEEQEPPTSLRRKLLNKWNRLENAIRDKSDDARSTTPHTHGSTLPHNDQVTSAASSRTPCAHGSTLPQDTDPDTRAASTQVLRAASPETPCDDGQDNNFLVLTPDPSRGQEERKFLVAQLHKDMDALQKSALRLMDESSKAKKRETELLAEKKTLEQELQDARKEQESSATENSALHEALRATRVELDRARNMFKSYHNKIVLAVQKAKRGSTKKRRAPQTDWYWDMMTPRATSRRGIRRGGFEDGDKDRKGWYRRLAYGVMGWDFAESSES